MHNYIPYSIVRSGAYPVTDFVLKGEHMNKLPGFFAFVISMPFLAGCASHQYVHWDDDWNNAVARAEALSERNAARVVSSTGSVMEARNLAFSRETLSWAPRRVSAVSTLPLGEVQGITVVQRRRTKEGALVGGIAGAITGLLTLSPSAVEHPNPFVLRDRLARHVSMNVLLSALVGAGVGALLGTSISDRVHFLP